MMQNTEYAADFERLLNVCQEQNVAVQTIKSVARQPGWGNLTQTHHTWYRPVEDQAAIDRAVHWVLARPGIFLNTPGDIYLLPSVLEASNRFEAAPSDQEMAADAARLDMEPIFS
jgi:hypothetical protein